MEEAEWRNRRIAKSEWRTQKSAELIFVDQSWTPNTPYKINKFGTRKIMINILFKKNKQKYFIYSILN